MKRFLTLLVLCLLALTPPARADEPNPDDMYFSVYTLMMKAEALQERGKAAEARTNYAEGLKILKEIQLDFPEWNPKVIKYRIGDFEAKAAPPAAKTVSAAKPRVSSASSETGTPTTMSTASAGSGEPVEMKIKWMTGKRYVERLSLDADVDVSQPGQAAQKGQLNFTQGLTLSALKDRDGGGKELEVELQDTTISAKMNGATMYGYAAGQPPQNGMVPPEVTAVVQKLKGAKLKFLTDAEGKVESVEGIEDLVKRLAMAADPTANPDLILKKLSSAEMSSVTDSMKDSFASMSGLPDKPVKIGDTWSPKLGSMKGMPEGTQVNYVYTFKGWEQHDNRRCALIQMSGDFSMLPGGGLGGMPAAKARLSGKIWFDPESNMIIETSLKPDINYTMTVIGSPGAAPASTAVTLHLTVDMKQLAMNDVGK